MNIGYARISTAEQCLDSQLDELKKAGCEKIFEDVASGSKTERKGLQEAIAFAREGDVLICWKLDRLGRSLTHLIETVTELKSRGIGFRCITQNLDTTTSTGRLIFHIFGSLAEFERELIRERTVQGLQSARSRGRFGGRPKAMDEKSVKMALTLHKDGKTPITEICKQFKVSRATFYRHLKLAA
jgi:DNA invertase Pin-like site-specific DNA recombinase